MGTDSGKDISEENINTLVKAAGGKIEPFFPALFAKICDGKDVSKFLKFGGGGGGGGGGGAAPAAAAGGGGSGGGAAKEEKKVVEEEEEDEAVDFDLFG